MMFAEESGRCPVCSSRSLMVCYGLAFGGFPTPLASEGAGDPGLGPYEVCEDCDEVVYKHVIEPGHCLHGLESAGSTDV